MVALRWQALVVGWTLLLPTQRILAETAAPAAVSAAQPVAPATTASLGSPAVAVPAPPAAPSAPSALSVAFQNGRLSVEANQARWDKVMKELRLKTGVFLHVSFPPEGSLTASFKDLPVEQAFRTLWGQDTNFVFVYGKGTPPAGSAAVPADVWVLGKASGEGSKTTSAGAEDRGAAKEASTASSAQAAVVDPTQALGQEFERNPVAARDAAIGSHDPGIRLKAIAALGQQTSVDSVHTLLKIGTLDSSGDSRIAPSALDALTGLANASPDGRRLLTEAAGTVGHPGMQDVAREILDSQPQRRADAPAGGN